MIYFDNAATSFPKPPGVEKAVSGAIRQLGGNPGRGGHLMAMKSAQEVYKARKLAAEMFDMEKEENVIFTLNCTHALNLVIYGVLQQGDHVVISDLEHNSVWRPLCDLKKKGVIDLTVAKTSLNDPYQTLAAFDRAVTFRTKLVICTYASNVTGTVLPIAAIAELAHSRGAMIAVDAAQSAGMLEISLQRMGLDFVCMPGHKGLYGPSGTGMLLIGCDYPVIPLMQGGTGSLSRQQEAPDFYPDRLECGTVNLCGICGLAAGMHFVSNQTIQKIYAHEYRLLRQVYHCLQSCNGVELYNNNTSYGWIAPVISFNIRGISGEDTARRLSDMGFALRGGLHCAPLAHQKLGTLDRGTARIGIGAFHSMNEVWRLCEAIKKLQDNV